jgi:hypothetical protein
MLSKSRITGNFKKECNMIELRENKEPKQSRSRFCVLNDF